MAEEKIKIDQTKCVGCGKCFEICPDCFTLNQESGKAEVKSETNLACAMNASDECPVNAIFVAE